MKIERVSLQSLGGDLGDYAAVRSCAPADFYMLAKAYGYLGKEPMSPGAFIGNYNRPHLLTGDKDWSRPALTAAVRQQFKAPIVSWWVAGDANIELMKKSGYIESDREVAFFKDEIAGRSVEDIVRDGHPVIVTMLPGLGSPENHNIHAVIISEWDDEGVTVIDPDDRNPKSRFDADYIRKFISPKGAVTVFLPPESQNPATI